MKKNTKIIFLSIKGVLNNVETLKLNQLFDINNCKLFQKLIDITHAKIILYSNHNYHKNNDKLFSIKTLLKNIGLKIEIIGNVDFDNLDNESIDKKIENYILSTDKISSFVILGTDDINFSSHSLLRKHFVKTSVTKGFTHVDFVKCKKILEM